MREQSALRICLAATAVICVLCFIRSRDAVDLVAAGLFGLVTYSTGQRRPGAFLGAMGAAAALLVIRAHQYLTGICGLTLLYGLSVAFAAVALVLAALARSKVAKD